jgi:hypothetical protein
MQQYGLQRSLYPIAEYLTLFTSPDTICQCQSMTKPDGQAFSLSIYHALSPTEYSWSKTDQDSREKLSTTQGSACNPSTNSFNMSRASSDDQLKFLLSCVRYSNCGKASQHSQSVHTSANSFQIDFVEVAKECGVVSRGAASVNHRLG